MKIPLEVILATVMTVSKEISAQTLMSVITQLYVTKKQNVPTLWVVIIANVKKATMETKNSVYWASVSSQTAPKTNSVSRRQLSPVNVKKGSHIMMRPSASILMNVQRKFVEN